MQLLIGLTMGNGMVISVTPTGNAIASERRSENGMMLDCGGEEPREKVKRIVPQVLGVQLL